MSSQSRFFQRLHIASVWTKFLFNIPIGPRSHPHGISTAQSSKLFQSAAIESLCTSQMQTIFLLAYLRHSPPSGSARQKVDRGGQRETSLYSDTASLDSSYTTCPQLKLRDFLLS